MAKFARCPFAKTTANCSNSLSLSFDLIRESASAAFDSNCIECLTELIPEPTARNPRRARVLIPPGYLHPGKRKH
jgi:hypothetical protein